MFGFVLSIFLLAFGIYLKITKHPGFASSKKFAWLFIALGIITFVARVINMKASGTL